jgi:hypothetical protein
MRKSFFAKPVLAAGALVLLASAALADDRPHLAKRASWKAPDPAAVREQVLSWVSEDRADKSSLVAAEVLWPQGAAEQGELLDRVCQILALGEPRAKQLIETCSQPRQQIALPDTAWLDDPSLPDFVRGNFRLYYGRWLVQELLYDEAAEQLSGLKVEEVADPAALLFYQAVVSHRMLAREEGLATISRLLENESQLPRRYASLARLMQADLDGLKEDSLDHIARRMEDIRRRLELGRAGPKVREVEDGVIASLDKLIEEMEKQAEAAAAAAAAAGGSGGPMPNSPAPDSMPLGGKGPGQVAKKPLGDGGGWGNLPPKERDEALQQIGQEFPAHYRDVIQQYFRRLATEGEQEGP